jgi:alpha-L-fucosidase
VLYYYYVALIGIIHFIKGREVMMRIKRLCACKTLSAGTFLMVIFAFPAVHAQTPPTAFGLTPNNRQIEWYHREQQAFIHFGPNTFQNVEWGDGTAAVTTFNPTNLNCGQWMRTLKAAGMTTGILVIKHHDGFCLWPSQYTDYCVKNATWKGGKGDVLREFTDSCHAYGIKAAIYLSPWDRHEELSGAAHPFGTQAYVTYYCNQIVELCKNKPYGPLYEIWQDGAGNVNALTEADYKKWTDTLHRYMPECVVWTTKRSYQSGDVRWVGNEGGTAGDPCWSTINATDVLNENTGVMNSGDINGDSYIPAETNVSIRPGWFYHPSESPKSTAQLWDMYFTSTARNTVWLLNFPPDTRGWMPSADSASGAGLGSYIYGTFLNNLLAGATVTALHPRGTGFEPANMVDNLESTYFASADGHNTDTITFVKTSSITFDCIMMQEVIELGHRTLNWSVDYSTNGTSWTTISAANNKQCIGFKRAIKWSGTVTAPQVRLRITNGRACPAIHTFGVYRQTQTTPPSNWNGLTPIVPKSTAVLPHDRTGSKALRTLRIEGDRIVLPADFGAGQVTVSILDMQGRCVQSFVAQANGFEQRVVLPSLKPGSYLVRCSNGRLALEHKFMNVR